jgi:hypothetical protein
MDWVQRVQTYHTREGREREVRYGLGVARHHTKKAESEKVRYGGLGAARPDLTTRER